MPTLSRLQEDGVFNEVRVAVVGNVDSGKSTLLGVLSKGVLDNGRGLARLNVFRHKHEVETGRTSDISKEILGFNDAAQPVNYSPVKTPTWPEICEHSSKVVMFMDLAGHEKYLKTTVFGLTGMKIVCWLVVAYCCFFFLNTAQVTILITRWWSLDQTWALLAWPRSIINSHSPWRFLYLW